MSRFLTLLVVALLVVAEVASLLALVDLLGASGAVLVLAADMAVGMLIIRWAVRGPTADRGWRIAAGVIIALPGLVLDLLGLLLLVPAARRWIASHLSKRTAAALRARGVSVVTVTDVRGQPRSTVVPGDVIPGTVVEDPTPDSAGGPAGPQPESGPRIVRGEIADTDES